MTYEEEDACMSCEEEDACMSLLQDLGRWLCAGGVVYTRSGLICFIVGLFADCRSLLGSSVRTLGRKGHRLWI